MKLGLFLLVLFIGLAFIANSIHASYIVTNLNVTITLNKNTSAQVTELLRVVITNASVGQYSNNRLALNLTLSDWQKLVGPTLVQHIINPKSSLYNFKFLPGPLNVNIFGQNFAYMLMTYEVGNVSIVNQTAPRIFFYRFNSTVFNFEHTVSGQALTPNTTLTIILPPGAQIKSAPYPIPDSPAAAFTNNYANTTTFSWFYDEPLSKFTLNWVIIESVQDEVANFFTSVYNYFGVFTYVIIAIVVLFFIIYTYLRVGGTQ